MDTDGGNEFTNDLPDENYVVTITWGGEGIVQIPEGDECTPLLTLKEALKVRDDMHRYVSETFGDEALGFRRCPRIEADRNVCRRRDEYVVTARVELQPEDPNVHPYVEGLGRS